MVKAFLGLSIGANVILWLAAVSLSRDTAPSGNICVPLYSVTGEECIEAGCVNK